MFYAYAECLWEMPIGNAMAIVNQWLITMIIALHNDELAIERQY